MVKLQFCEQEEVARSHIRGVRGLWNHRNALLSQNFDHRDRRVTRGIQLLAMLGRTKTTLFL